MQLQDSGSLPARAFLGQGAGISSLSFENYYATEDEVSVNTILMTENSQLLTKEED
jgi:hypothetical protein